MGTRGVAQLASASGLGPEGPVFESQYPDFKKQLSIDSCFFLYIFDLSMIRAFCGQG